MLMLKHPTPDLRPEKPSEETFPHDPGLFSLVDCPLQGIPSFSRQTARRLGQLVTEIRRRLKRVNTMVCHPHRIGARNCVSLTLSNASAQEVNLLLVVSGEICFPEDFSAPRWIIQVADAVDLIYLQLWLQDTLQ